MLFTKFNKTIKIKLNLKKVRKKRDLSDYFDKKGEPQLSRHNIHYKTKDHKFQII